VVGLVIGAILVYSLIRRDKAVLYALAGFVLFLLPVSLLPNQRAPFYTYAPQMFLILLGCLLLERLFAVSKREMVRWVAAVAVALAMMSWTASFRRSAYFLNRVSFTNTVRSTTAVSAADALRLLPKVASGSHIYVNHGDQMPWLFVPGPCAFFQVLQKDSTIECVMNQPKDALRTLYVKDPGPKQFLDYKEDGSLTIADGTSN